MLSQVLQFLQRNIQSCIGAHNAVAVLPALAVGQIGDPDPIPGDERQLVEQRGDTSHRCLLPAGWGKGYTHWPALQPIQHLRAGAEAWL